MRVRIALNCLAFALVFATPSAASEAPFTGEIFLIGVEDEVYTPTGCETFFVGSSSFRFWSRMQHDFAKRTTLKRGFGGATIAEINHHFDKVVGRYRPKQVVFYAGENDTHRKNPVSEALADFQTFLNKKNAVLTNTHVIFVSVKPSVARAADFALQTKLNEEIARLADERDDHIYVDIVQPMLRDGLPRSELCISDNLHMNEMGYAIWTQRINRALRDKKSRENTLCATQ